MKERIRQNVASAPSAVYGLGFIGATIYFIQHATSFGMGVAGVFKALVWPALMVYHLFEYLKL